MPTDPNTDNQEATSNEQSQEMGQASWKQSIPPDLKDKPFWSNYKDDDLGGLLKTTYHAQERLGRSITLPANDNPEEWNSVYDKLGRPKDKSEYKVSLPKLDGFEWHEPTFDKFKEVAHNIGLNQKQVESVVQWFSDDVQTKLSSAQDQGLERIAITETKLKKELGQDYDMAVALGKRASNLYFGPEATEEWFDTMPEPVVKGLMKLGRQLAEDKVFGNNPVEMQGVTTKAKALEEINSVMADRKHPYWGDPFKAETKQARDRMEQLHKVAYPD